MQCGLIVGRVVKIGYGQIKPPQATKMFGQAVPSSGGFSSGLSGRYKVALEGARVGEKAISVTPAEGVGRPETDVEKSDGTFALPFRWGPEPSVNDGPVTIDVTAFYIPKDNYMNRQRALRGKLLPKLGSAHAKTIYLVKLDDSGYPDVSGVAALVPYSQVLWKAVWDITTNSRMPAWDQVRLKYSQMLCSSVDIPISEGGVSG